MAEQWYYTQNRQQQGPVSFEELQQLAERGNISPRDLVWKEGMPEWVSAGAQGIFPEVLAVQADAPQPILLTPVDDPEEYRPRRSARGRDEYDDDDYRPRRRSRVSRYEGGMPVGLK